MKQTHILSMTAAFGLVAGTAFAYGNTNTEKLDLSLSSLTAVTGDIVPVESDDSIARVAQRLQKRIEARYDVSPTLSSLRVAVASRQKLFQHVLAVHLQEEDTHEQVSTWFTSLGRYPEWMRFSLRGTTPRFEIDRDAIAATLETQGPDGITKPSSAVVISTSEDKTIQRAVIEGQAIDGHTYNSEELIDLVVEAFDKQEDVVTVDVERIDGEVLWNDGTQTYALTELGVGRSEFASSPYGRKMNVRKAMQEKANGIIIPSGSTFSFNATLGGPITNGNGWYDSLIIVNGKDLEPAPGGGICQAATTVFRAAVAAGLPITVRKSHSLYVTYYKQYGMGLDATVFPGKQDMKFENDTAGPLILVGKTDEYDNAYSTIYGIDDQRSIALDGPYFGYTHKEPVMGRTLRNSEVAWIQRVQKQDGSMTEKLLVAQYSQLPKSVALEFEPKMHGAADLVVDAR